MVPYDSVGTDGSRLMPVSWRSAREVRAGDDVAELLERRIDDRVEDLHVADDALDEMLTNSSA